MTAWRERGACRCAPRSARKKFADYARRRDPRAGLGRGVRPSPISTERGGRRREPQLTPAGRRCSGRREAPYSDREAAKRDRGPSKVAVMPLLALVIIVLGAGLAAVAPLYLRLVRRELSRADRMERAARMLGLQFSRGDPAYPGSIGQAFPFELFSRGIEQTCENVMTGTIGGVPVTALDFLYVQQVDSGTQHPDGTADYRALRSEPVRYACGRSHRRASPARRDRAGLDAAGRARRAGAGPARVGRLQREIPGVVTGTGLRDRAPRRRPHGVAGRSRAAPSADVGGAARRHSLSHARPRTGAIPGARRCSGRVRMADRTRRVRLAQSRAVVRNELEQASVGIAEVHARPAAPSPTPRHRSGLDRNAVAVQVFDRAGDRAVPFEAQVAVPRRHRHTRDHRWTNARAMHIELLLADAVSEAPIDLYDLDTEHVSIESVRADEVAHRDHDVVEFHRAARYGAGERADEWEYVRCGARYAAGKIQEGGSSR